jgi:hypothetical protein
LANVKNDARKLEDATQIASVKMFRSQHPRGAEQTIDDYFSKRQKVYKSLVEKTDAKYKRIAKEQAAKRNLAKAIALAEAELKDRKLSQRVSGQQ